MVNYQEGLIYKIAHRYSPYVYIGSTTNFNRRKSQHKACCNNQTSKQYNQKVYQTIREMGGWDNFEMVLVVKYPCNDKKELHAKEFEYQQLFDVNMNMNDATSGFDLSVPEYNKIYQKKYNQKNKEKINKNKKEYFEKHREKTLEYQKEYNQKNKEKILGHQKKYREKMKEKLKEQMKEKVECECGCVISRSTLSRHRKTPRHAKLMSA